MSKGMLDLSGKVTVITGGNSGLGLGFARGIAKNGGDVVLWARNEERNAKAKAELEQFGVRVATRKVDVANESEVLDGYKAVMDEFGRVDAAIANAGWPPTTRSSFDLTTEHWHEFLGVSLHGAFYTLREAARLMVQRAEAGEPGGSLIHCSSLSQFNGLGGKPQYAAAKAGMSAVIRAFAVEFGKYGIRANNIAPGYIKTGMTGETEEWSDIDKYMASKTPIPRPGFPADFEAAVAYLVSDASAYHTGDTLVIDGAQLINM